MIENENYKYEIYDKYICEQNIDRIKFFKNELKDPKIDLLSAGYHLNKDTQNKTGGIFFFQISPDKKLIPLKENNILLDYGILDIKFSQNNNLIFTANSDYSYTIFNLINNTLKKTYLCNNEKLNEKIKITNDVIEIDTSEQKIFSGSNDGNIYINDINSEKNILSIEQGHEFGIWSLKLLDDNNFLSGGEDAKIKLWDLRLNNPDNKNIKNLITNDKSYNSSINYIDRYKFDLSNNIIITGSYDEKIIFFDIRKLKEEIKVIKTEHSSWDIKQSTIGDKNILLISSIYEGFNIWEIADNKYDMKHVLRLPLTKDKDIFHKSIVYGLDIKNNNKKNIDILSCSFYDNLMMYWNYAPI